MSQTDVICFLYEQHVLDSSRFFSVNEIYDCLKFYCNKSSVRRSVCALLWGGVVKLENRFGKRGKAIFYKRYKLRDDRVIKARHIVLSLGTLSSFSNCSVVFNYYIPFNRMLETKNHRGVNDE